ncbi:aminotransferase class IV [Bizionia argentinensis JUB59]|uniref:branched-chain-amino-acid transaminase n=1 Tax=Bizionia argentinensis JUB59 TaxID=1046627 RepID=G2ECE7_9FLAO|nr:aminotransferase class IV [Bizionia argentinensis]EGV43864.1 aminotransferase class IV [Bizionia argentinensis JUB59]
MINFNGNITDNLQTLSINNRGFAYGDAIFETCKYSHGNLLFWEDHYFRLMASMRIMRMEIPMNFTMEFLEAEIQKTLVENEISNKTARVKLTVFRDEGGLYKPSSKNVGFVIAVSPLETDFYLLNDAYYEVDLFKDFYVSPSLLSTLKTNNKAINIVGSVYAEENNLQNALLINTDKKVVEALNGNLFLVKEKTIKTPPLADGCLKGVMRKQIIDLVAQLPEYELEEASISPFELQKSDELFITNVITGIQPISKYRKKEFNNTVAKMLLQKLQVKIRLAN